MRGDNRIGMLEQMKAGATVVTSDAELDTYIAWINARAEVRQS